MLNRDLQFKIEQFLYREARLLDERRFPLALFTEDIRYWMCQRAAAAGDARLWVPERENVWVRPLCLSASAGYWVNLARVRGGGLLSRHRRPQPVHGFVAKGRWRYLERDWEAVEGTYVYEPAGDTHTLVVDEDVPEMITLFQVGGALIYVDPDGKVTGSDDVFSKIDLCRRHFIAAGLGDSFVEQFIR